MFKLNNLKFNEGSLRKKKKVGRGHSGKSHGRGNKGQKARSGVSLSNFQGGQTPIHRRLPKQISFYTKKTMVGIPVDYVERLIDNSFISENITKDQLIKFGLVPKNMKCKIIGSCSRKIEIEADAFSSGCLKSIEKMKGKAILIK